MKEHVTWNPAAPIKVHKNQRTILIPTFFLFFEDLKSKKSLYMYALKDYLGLILSYFTFYVLRFFKNSDCKQKGPWEFY
jgi:hypothetical protein